MITLSALRPRYYFRAVAEAALWVCIVIVNTSVKYKWCCAVVVKLLNTWHSDELQIVARASVTKLPTILLVFVQIQSK